MIVKPDIYTITSVRVNVDNISVEEKECFLGEYRLLGEMPDLVYYWNNRLIEQDGCMRGLLVNIV